MEGTFKVEGHKTFDTVKGKSLSEVIEETVKLADVTFDQIQTVRIRTLSKELIVSAEDKSLAR